MDKAGVEIFTQISSLVDLIDEKLCSNASLHSLTEDSRYVGLKKKLREKYNNLSLEEKKEFNASINKEFSNDPQMNIYLLSIILSVTHNEEIITQIANVITCNQLDPFYNVLIEFEIAHEIFVNSVYEDMYYLRRKLHSNNVERFAKFFQLPQHYIAYGQRNANRIVVITEQILGAQHAPSKIILETCYTLQKFMGKEVMLIVCPTNMTIDDQISWFEIKYQVHMPELNGNKILTFDKGEIYCQNEELGNKFIINYKGVSIRGQQVLFDNKHTEALQNIFREIHEYNPLFVYNMGCINPMADLCNKFTTVVANVMSYGYPVSEAPILLVLDQGSATGDAQFDSILNSGQQIIKYGMQFAIEDSGLHRTRAEFGIKETEFVITIVGNRLPVEMTDDFIHILKDLFDQRTNVSLLLIGSYENYQKDFDDEIFFGRVHYVSHQKDLLPILRLTNLYLNPPRKGGGTSALIALYAGVPVLTLPDCDVAGNVGQAFTYAQTGDLVRMVERYQIDERFYKEQQELGLRHVAELMDSSSKLKEVITNVEKIIRDMDKG